MNNRFNKYINSLIFRILLVIMIFFSLIISSNYNFKFYDVIKKNLMEKNMDLSVLNKLSKRYFNKLIPIINDDNNLVSAEVNSEYIPYKDGYKVIISGNYPITALNSGIVVFIGDKEEYGKTVIIQGINEIDYWYSNINVGDIKIYDYIKKGEIIGETDESLILSFQKNGEFIDINEIGI